MKFRIGELFGNGTKDQIGFIQSSNYVYDGVWEHEKGKRVPKKINVNLGIKVIYDEVPGITVARNTAGEVGAISVPTFHGWQGGS